MRRGRNRWKEDGRREREGGRKEGRGITGE
jgi:hypothetical protein